MSDSIDVNLNVEPPSNDIDWPKMNVIQAIVNSSRILAAENQLPRIKAIHICWLLHNVGDIHQPLHSSALFSRRLFPRGTVAEEIIKTTINGNLHSVWDRALGGDITTEQARNSAIALWLERIFKARQAAAAELSPLAMWEESHALAVAHAYNREVLVPLRSQDQGNRDLQAIPLSQDYLTNRRRVCERTAVRAGIRCAGYLSALTGDRPDGAFVAGCDEAS